VRHSGAGRPRECLGLVYAQRHTGRVDRTHPHHSSRLLPFRKPWSAKPSGPGGGKPVPEHNTRKPTLLLRLSGLFLLRLAERAFSGLLIQDPPRSTPNLYRGARPAPSCLVRHIDHTGCRPDRPAGADAGPPASDQWPSNGPEHNTRKPTPLWRPPGLTPSRKAERANSGLTNQDPPRSTR